MEVERQTDQPTKKKRRKAIWFFILIIISVSLLIAFYQIIPSSLVSVDKQEQTPEASNLKESKIKSILSFDFKRSQPDINILILGRPGQGYSGQNLTDTIILAHIESKKEEVTLISLPRDFLVKIPNTNQLSKINAVYQLKGIDVLKEKVEEITGLPVDYHFLIDLVVAQEIIELVDGLNVYVPRDIYDPYFPGPNYSYQIFELSSGWRYLDGAMALKYIRTRYTSPNGDFDRMARQQQVVQLLKRKVLELNLLWDFPTYLKMFDTLKSHIETDLGLLEMKSLWQMARSIKADQIYNLVIDKKETDLMIGGQVLFGQQMASVVFPKAGQTNYQEIKEYIQDFIE